MSDSVRRLCQHMTPLWVAEALVERHFGALGSSDLVVEPSCGTGAFLAALPASVPAVGVEIDPALAALARASTGREVVVGDFRTVPLDLVPTAVLGNPPFRAQLFDGILDRCHALLPDGALAGFVLPAYMLQSSMVVDRVSERWSIATEMIPRDLFGRISTPLTFVVFRKDRRRCLVGMALFREATDVRGLHARYRQLLSDVSRSAWGRAVAEALFHAGGEADLATIYRAMEGRRPTRNEWWRERVRNELQLRFRRVGPGRWAIPEAA